MLQLSRRTVRHAWPPYVGALVALAFGVALLAAAVSVGVAAEDARLADLSSLFGIMSGVALFMAVFVVGSTFGFVVATRRRQLALLRLVGATPRQVRAMVLGESLVVAVLAAVAGCAVATVTTPAFVAVLRWRGVVPDDFDLPAPYLGWAVAAPTGLVVALLGAWRSSKRAARVSPVAVFQETAVERRRPTVTQLVIGTLCLGGSAALLALSPQVNPVFALVLGILLPEVLVLGLYCLGGWVFPALAGLLGRPFAERDVAARLARDHVRTAVRAPVALAAPVLAISAVAGSMILTLSLTADWTSALDREQLAAPYVVETGGADVADRLAGVPLADPRTTVTVALGHQQGRQEVDVVDPVTTPAARGLQVLRGSLDGLEHGVAVTGGFATDAGVGLGDRLAGGRVVAVVRDAPDLYGEVVIGRDLVPAAQREVTPDTWFVDPGEQDLHALLSGTGARVLTADAWVDEVDAQTRAGNDLGLWVLLGPVALYAGIAIVNTVLVGASQRRTQLRTAHLLGATPDQLRRMALWEAGLVGAAGLLVGGLVTTVVGISVRAATTADVAGQALTVPWLPLAAIVATCAVLVLAAALVGSRSAVRPARA